MKKFSGILLILSSLLISATAFARPAFMPGQLVVKSDSEDIVDYNVVKVLPKSGLTVIQVQAGKELRQAMKLRAKGVKASLNYIATASTPLIPDDRLYQYQWHLPSIQMPDAWSTTKGAGVRVAVLDTGIAYGASDGVNLCADGHYDAVNLDNNPEDGSQLSHGTHVAGTIAQNTVFPPDTGGVGVAGVAPEACIVVVKVLNDRGSGTFADIAEGIWHAVGVGAQIINMSLGVNAAAEMMYEENVNEALDEAEANNVLVVAAAGNDGYTSNVSYPAIVDTVVAVGATDLNNNVVGYSNRGTGLDIVAPGGDTSADENGDGYSDGVLQETKYRNKFGYYFLQGTSMASPHVAGVAALLIANGLTNVSDVRAALMGTAILESGQTASNYGAGLVQASDALGVEGSGGGVTEPVQLATPTNLTPNETEPHVLLQEIDPEFSWSSVYGADSYLVKIGVDIQDPDYTIGVSGNSFTLSEEKEETQSLLQNDTVYFWTVQAVSNDPINEPNSSVANAEFKTVAAPEPEPPTGGCIPTASNEKGPRGSDNIDNDCDGWIDGDDPH